MNGNLLKQKTTWLGLTTIVSGLVSFAMTKDPAVLSTSCATGLGLILAQDAR